MVLSATLLALLGLWAFRQKPGPLRASALGILGGLAASPIAWVHYTLFLLPIFFTRRWTPPMAAAAALLVVPVHVVLRFLDAPLWQQATVGSIYNWAVVLCLAAVAAEELRRTPKFLGRGAFYDADVVMVRKAPAQPSAN
jgi:hypothetical protein